MVIGRVRVLSWKTKQNFVEARERDKVVQGCTAVSTTRGAGAEGSLCNNSVVSTEALLVRFVRLRRFRVAVVFVRRTGALMKTRTLQVVDIMVKYLTK